MQQLVHKMQSGLCEHVWGNRLCLMLTLSRTSRFLPCHLVKCFLLQARCPVTRTAWPRKPSSPLPAPKLCPFWLSHTCRPHVPSLPPWTRLPSVQAMRPFTRLHTSPLL